MAETNTSPTKTDTSSAEKDKSSAKKDKPTGPPWTLFLIVISTGTLGIALFGIKSDLSVAVVELMVGLASLCLGSLIGFLFGIPRTLARGNARQSNRTQDAVADDAKGDQDADDLPDGSEIPYQPGTSLEQIADWLTKIFVGVGLVELRTVSSGMGRIATFVQCDLVPRVAATSAEALSQAATMPAPCVSPAPGIAVLTQGVIVIFSIIGFGASYLWTRLNFRGMQVSEDNFINALWNRFRSQDAKITKATRIAEAGLPPKPVDGRTNIRGLAGPGADNARYTIPTTWPPELRGKVQAFLDSPDKWDSDPNGKFFQGVPREANGRVLETIFSELPNQRLVLTFTVRPSRKKPVRGTVTILLHPTFPEPMVQVKADDDGVAEFSVVADGWFTAVAIADDGNTVLAYNLSTMPNAPIWFRAP